MLWGYKPSVVGQINKMLAKIPLVSYQLKISAGLFTGVRTSLSKYAYYAIYLYILCFLYFDARPVSVQAGPPFASGCPLRVHPDLDDASHRHRVGL